MVDEIQTFAETGNPSPELVPVAGPGALSEVLLPTAGSPTGEPALGDLLSDVLFGEVIDISDLIPQVLSPAALVSEMTPLEAAELGKVGGGDILATDQGVALTILYDDNILTSGGTVL